jgi:hypothetical protein
MKLYGVMRECLRWLYEKENKFEGWFYAKIDLKITHLQRLIRRKKLVTTRIGREEKKA